MKVDGILISDSHGAYVDPRVWRLCKRFISRHKPSLRIHLGDWLDYPGLRRGASDEDPEFTVAQDLSSGAELMEAYCPTHLLLGNHDWRALRKARALGARIDLSGNKFRRTKDVAGTSMEAHGVLAAINTMEKCLRKVPVWDYSVREGVVPNVVPGWNLLHGYASGISGLRRMVSIFGNLICGHLHAGERVVFERWPHGEVGQCCPMLCRHGMEYERAKPRTLAHEQGWLFYYRERGKTIVRAEIV